MDNERWTVDNKQWTMDNGQWTMDKVERTKDKGQRTKDNEQRTKNKGQRTHYKGQRTKDKEKRTKDKLQVISGYYWLLLATKSRLIKQKSDYRLNSLLQGIVYSFTRGAPSKNTLLNFFFNKNILGYLDISTKKCKFVQNKSLGHLPTDESQTLD